jgi:hypothetical protein
MLKNLWPHLFSYAKMKMFVRKVLDHEDLFDLFYLPLSEESFLQFGDMGHNSVHLSHSV